VRPERGGIFVGAEKQPDTDDLGDDETVEAWLKRAASVSPTHVRNRREQVAYGR